MYERTQLWNPKHDILDTVLYFVVSKYYFHIRSKTRAITGNGNLHPLHIYVLCKGHNSPDRKPFHLKFILGT